MSHLFYLTPQVLLPFSPLTSREFELIRRKAQASWQEDSRWSDSSMTTYSGSYREKQLEESKCGRLACREVQLEPECQQTSLHNGSDCSPLLFPAGSQETANGQGPVPDITRLPKTSLQVKHRVAHQTWSFSDPAPPNHGKLCECHDVRCKKLHPKAGKDYKYEGRNFLKQLQQQWDSESSFGSSKDSDTDQYRLW
uniref:Uncharacterized protein n=1 Tax=Castor canadensis TaxID=51338 RepID=A0A8C0X9Y0_CASCN